MNIDCFLTKPPRANPHVLIDFLATPTENTPHFPHRKNPHTPLLLISALITRFESFGVSSREAQAEL